ncbi:tol [Fusarium coicis]|nr:tol [Fusarium coicis]
MTSSLQLPTWYHRVSEAVKNRNGVILWDFDEDISDLDETKPDETIAYNGPDAAEYHCLRGKREERKRELFQRKETVRKRREDAREEEKNKTDQVRAAYEALEISMSRTESSRLGPIDSQFDLYCRDYFDRFYDPSPHSYQRRYIRFEYEDRGEAHSGNRTGRFWLNPKIYITDGRFFMGLQSIDKDPLILRASRDLIFWATPQGSPGLETFIFMGVYNDWGKQLQAFARMLRPALAPPTKFLSVQDETLCEFCRDDELIPRFRTRALSNLTESSRYCKLCAMWLGALDHSRQNLKVRGQVALLRQHPLEQDIGDVTLVFMSSSVRPYIVWPHIGYVWATLDTINIDGAKDINLKPLPRSDQADATWKSVREWLDRCQKYHKECQLQRTPTWKPTRLLYVCNTQATLQVRLVESQKLPDGTEYLTLSHCLGIGKTLQLTRSNIEAFRSSIPVDELARVFIDACNTTKRLSHEYLWIDALCIIQDDPTDREHELTIATDRLVALSGLVDVLYPVFQQMVEPEDEVEDRHGRGSTQTEAGSLSHSSTGLFLAGLWRPYAERQLVWRAMSRDHPFTYDGNALSVPGKRYDEYIAPTWSWCSVKDAAIEPQEVRSGNIYFTKVIDTNIIPDRKLNPATPLSSLRYCSSPGSFLRLRCSYLPIVELGPVSGMKLMNFRAAAHESGWVEEAIDVQSKNYWDVEFSQEAIDCKSPIAVPIFARTDFANSVYCLALDERRGEKGNIWYIRLGAFVITYPEDVLRLWEGIGEFDKHMPEECARHDGLYRFKELKWGKCTYVKMDEVLQRIVEIR